MIPGCSAFIIPIEYPLFCVLCFVNPFGFVSLYFSIRYDIYEPNIDDLMTTLRSWICLSKKNLEKSQLYYKKGRTDRWTVIESIVQICFFFTKSILVKAKHVFYFVFLVNVISAGAIVNYVFRPMTG